MSKTNTEKELDLSSAVLKLSLDCKKFWDINKCLSYNRMFNVIMGGRGIGKTTQIMIWCLMQRLTKGKKFIYLRRYTKESGQQRNLMSKYLDNCTFIGDGNGGGEYRYGKHVLGYLKTLVASQDYKSVDFDDVDYLIYDEAILMPGQPKRYLKDEINVLLELMSTVFRARRGYKVFIIGNNLDFFNPYCQYFNVEVFNRVYVGDEMYIEYAENSPELIECEKETPLYKLTKGTSYHEYHYNNQVYAPNNREIKALKKNDTYMFAIKINTYTLRFYANKEGDYYVADATKKELDDDSVIILLENGEINYFFLSQIKHTNTEKIILYYYYHNKLFGASQEANNLLDMLLEIII